MGTLSLSSTTPAGSSTTGSMQSSPTPGCTCICGAPPSSTISGSAGPSSSMPSEGSSMESPPGPSSSMSSEGSSSESPTTTPSSSQPLATAGSGMTPILISSLSTPAPGSSSSPSGITSSSGGGAGQIPFKLPSADGVTTAGNSGMMAAV